MGQQSQQSQQQSQQQQQQQQQQSSQSQQQQQQQQQQRNANTNNSNPAADYSEGASHVLAVIHEILAHHRAVEQRWSTKKLKLHQRLALRLFQEDVKQVCKKIKTSETLWSSYKISWMPLSLSELTPY